MLPRVLLIDDELQAARPLARLLESAGARMVDWAPAASTAYAIVVDERVDIIVSDYDLGPGSPTGVELLSNLRVLCPSAKMVCISAAARSVPGWCAFVAKTDLDGLRAVITNWQ